MSVVAGTLANGGRCPTTNERIFSPETVQSVLSVMFTCGMYDFSGQFSFSMGFPSVGLICSLILNTTLHCYMYSLLLFFPLSLTYCVLSLSPMPTPPTFGLSRERNLV